MRILLNIKVMKLVITSILFASISKTAFALLEIDITKGVVDPLPIAVSVFHSEGPAASGPADRISAVVAKNLQRSGLFRVLDQRAYIQTPAAMQVQPRFSDWRAINAQALVTGMTTLLDDGRLRVEFRLWDVFLGQQMTGLAYCGSQ